MIYAKLSLIFHDCTYQESFAYRLVLIFITFAPFNLIILHMPLRIKGMQSGNNQELIKLRPVLSDADILQNALLSCTEVQVHNLQ